MKLLTSLTLSLFAITTLNAQTTMCFKENHKSMATIENTKLDGGECKGQNSVKDMQRAGWNTDDIKITSTANGHNYIYIFKKDEVKVTSIDEAALETKILQRLEQRKKEEIALRKKEALVRKSRSGEALYKKTCITCHGEKGEIKARNTSRPLRDLNLDDFELSIRGYTIGEYNRGMSAVMQPYANGLTQKEVRNVYIYLKSINKKEEANK